MEDAAYFLGASKKDLDNHWAQVVGKISNYKKDKDRLEATISSLRTEELIISLNGIIVYSSVLPGPVTEYKQKVSSERGSKAKITVKIKKATPGTWVDKWSPIRNEPSSSIGSAVGSSSLSSDSFQNISLPKMF